MYDNNIDKNINKQRFVHSSQQQQQSIRDDCLKTMPNISNIETKKKFSKVIDHIQNVNTSNISGKIANFVHECNKNDGKTIIDIQVSLTFIYLQSFI